MCIFARRITSVPTSRLNGFLFVSFIFFINNCSFCYKFVVTLSLFKWTRFYSMTKKLYTSIITSNLFRSFLFFCSHLSVNGDLTRHKDISASFIFHYRYFLYQLTTVHLRLHLLIYLWRYMCLLSNNNHFYVFVHLCV